MQIYNELNLNKGLSLAFGFFDGIHLGHKEVIKSAVDFARENGTKSAVITFQDHPCCFFYHVPPKYILKKEDRAKMLEDLGVDYLYCLKFDKHLSEMMAFDYLKEIIMKNFEPMAISTGFNHYFGAKKSGDVHYLTQMQEKLHYKYFEVPPKLYHEEVISSTRIREDLSLGKIEFVNAMLGYDYYLVETVVMGQQIGRTIGFKTANLCYPDDLVDVARGVYKVTVEHDGNMYRGIANYGLRPTVQEKIKEKCDESEVSKEFVCTGTCDLKPTLEVHILDFDKEIYGEKIKVTFLKKIRDEKKFDSLEELKKQIKNDINSIG